MRIAIAIDWSEHAFAAAATALRLYRPDEVSLIHAAELRPFENPLLAPAVAKRVYEEFREAMIQGGRKLLDQVEASLPNVGARIIRHLEVGRPAAVILDRLKTSPPDLVVAGSRGRGRLTELALGSVSHRILLHASCSTLIVKRPMSDLRRVLVAVEGSEDAARVRQWLRTFPFANPVDVVLLSIVAAPQAMDPATIPPLASWTEAAMASAQNLVNEMAGALPVEHYRTIPRVAHGEPSDEIVKEAEQCDLVVVGSQARTAVERFLLGSVSHAVTHHAACPVLVVR